MEKETVRIEYFDHFIEFWLPIYKKQVFKAKYENDIDALLVIKENIYKNWHFDKVERNYIIQELGIEFLFKKENL